MAENLHAVYVAHRGVTLFTRLATLLETNHRKGLVRLLEELNLVFGKFNIDGTWERVTNKPRRMRIECFMIHIPSRSFKLSRLVLPTIGAVTPGLDITHAAAT